tara:strand:- start:26 stop:400 length:375 start_codon:yes stop_codon:yes gene_type:complete
MKHFFSLIFILSSCTYLCFSQSDIPGQTVFEAVFGKSVELDYKKCCFAAYGWHKTSKIKFEEVHVQDLDSEDIAFELLQLGILPIDTEQYFTTPSGQIVIVSKEENFKKVYDRFLINLDAKKDK